MSLPPRPPVSERIAALVGLFRSPRWDRDRLIRYQGERLSRIVRHAAEKVPFYRNAFLAAGIDPDTIRTAADVGRLPIIQKADVQRNPDAFLAQGLHSDGLVWYLTSGSTGEPMRVCRSMFEERLLQAFRLRAELLLGMRLTDHRAAVLFTTVPRNERRPAKPTLLSRIGILPRTVVDNTAPEVELIQALRTIRPQVIAGHPGSLSRVASEMNAASREAIRPRFIVTGAETLHPEIRERIQNGFDSRVYDFYGAHECNLVAFECTRASGFHFCEDNVLVEILRDGQPVRVGEEGEVVITTLHSYAMPFLRYRLGDVVVRGAPCGCGLPFAMMTTFQGRSAEVARLANGATVGSIPLANVFLARVDWIRQFQMVQTEAGKLDGYVVPYSAPEQAHMDEIVTEFHLNWGIALSLHVVERLPVQPSGKMPVFVSRLAD